MKQFNEVQKQLLERLAQRSEDTEIQMIDFLEEVFFKAAAGRSMILQLQAKQAIYYMPVLTFSNPLKKHQEIQQLVALIELLQFLETASYITLHSKNILKERTMIFLNDQFIAPKTVDGKIILNARGDNTSQSEIIRDKDGKVIYKGVIFTTNAFYRMSQLFTGTLCISPAIKQLIPPSADTKEAPPIPNHTPSLASLSFFSKLNLIIHIMMLLLIGTVVFLGYTYYRPTSHESTTPKTSDTVEKEVMTTELNVQQQSGRKKRLVTDKQPTSPASDKYYGANLSLYPSKSLKQLAKNEAMSFAIFQASRGTWYKNARLKKQYAFAAEHNWLKGAYHMYLANKTPARQATNYYKALQRIDSLELPPIVYLSQKSFSKKLKKTVPEFQKEFIHFLKQLKQKTKKTPIVYTDTGTANTYLSDANAPFGNYPLWLIDTTQTTTPQLPEAWKKKGYVVWQRSDYRKPKGTSKELDISTENMRKLSYSY
ncbi:hypothetical protein HN014_19060 [Aquimarina sp. TRL1]|uniref:GH25 family lysozyme n=1 Tax=Aquimarina sp. (strain TRL1) TaxID=2736252 RepID=UPI00158A8074|nr:GH25 family lysozyme [Aquimarina sp. TRL1]QKX06929.1 hypothetical protein HN014_19060 [Aquimarina sp. TRL1]